jgi:hypothetical protein
MSEDGIYACAIMIGLWALTEPGVFALVSFVGLVWWLSFWGILAWIFVMWCWACFYDALQGSR